ncbi:MAG: hypothetical protein QQN63_02595 [Nitrosopumilus sp.]
MLNIPTKVDGVDTLSAAEFNSSNNELKNFITSSGQGLSAGDLFQIAKSSAAYAGSGTTYADSGSVNSYILSPFASFQAVNGYTEGLLVKFLSITANTGAATINVNGNGVKNLVSPQGSPLVAGALPLGRYVEARFDGPGNRFILQKGFEDVSGNTGKNLFINANFQEWQRGTSQTSSGFGSVDRWSVNLAGATITMDQQTHTLGQTDVPFNPKFFLKYDVTASAASTRIQYKMEKVATIANTEVTLSYYAKGVNPGAGTFLVNALQIFGTGGSPSSLVNISIATPTLTASFQRFTHTFTLPSISGKTLGTNLDDFIQLQIGQNISDSSTDAWNIQISNIQIEFGEIATDFEFVTEADQLARCQRYFFKSPGFTRITMQCLSTTRCFGGNVTHPVVMRRIPDITFDTTSTYKILDASGASNDATSIITESTTATPQGFALDITVASGLIAGNATSCSNAATGFGYEANAEL